MKKRLSPTHILPSLFNLGLHQAKKPVLTQWEDPSQYERKTEALENPTRKALRLTEFVSLFWTLCRTEAKIALINTDEEQAFSYEDWFEGTSVKCYEEPWTPGLWSNPLLKNQTPDIVILLSISSKERTTVLGELQSLRLPIINFSMESSDWNQFPAPGPHNHQTAHFYMEIIRSILLRVKRLQMTARPAPGVELEEKDFYAQMPLLLVRYRKQLTNATISPSWPHSKKYPRHHGKKKLISLKRKKRYVLSCLKTMRSTRLTGRRKKTTPLPNKKRARRPRKGRS